MNRRRNYSTENLTFWQVFRLILIGLLFVAGSSLIMLFPISTETSTIDLNLGDIAPEDIRAPHDVSYVSEIDTQAAQDIAVSSVQDVYDPPNPRLGRQQVSKARQMMTFIEDVRADPFADNVLRGQYLGQVTTTELSDETIDKLLSVPESQFALVEREVVSLIEESMSGPVKEGLVENVRSQLELKVSSDLPEDLIPVVLAISRGLIVPNSTLNVSETEAARAQALQSVRDVTNSYRPGEIVIRAGDRVDERDLEALNALGLEPEQLTFQGVTSVVLLNLLSVVLLAVYLFAFNKSWADDPGYLLVITILILLFLFVGQIMVPGREGIAVLFPAAALSMSLTALIGFEFAAIVTVVLAMLIGYLSTNSLEIMTLIGLSGLLAGGSLQHSNRLYSFFRSGIVAALAGITVLLVFRLPGEIDMLRLLELMFAAVLSGLLSAGIALVILFVVSIITGWVTGLQLNDLDRSDHPLQKKLQQQALGTYQHTVSVVNLVEAACECIGADSLLARVGALYHDVGKLSNPGFFIENRIEGGTNPHDKLTPLASARIIKAHVPDGVELARKHRIPARVIDFIIEHHGTMPILFFLNAAQEEAEQSGTTIVETDFHYDGPIPQSREAAILMLSDSCESAVRAARPTSGDEIEKIVTKIIQQRLDYNQLDDSGLTLGNIKAIRERLIRTLKGMYHPRVQYPEKQQPSTLPAGAAAGTALPEDTRPGIAPVEAVIVEEVNEQKETL